MLVEFSGVVQRLTESLDREIKPDEIYQSLLDEYVVDSGPYKLVDYDLLTGREEDQRCVARLEVNDELVNLDGEGSGPIEAFVNALVATLNEPLNIVDYHEHALREGKDAKAICLLAIDNGESGERCYGVGLSRNTIRSSLEAIVSALNRRWRER